MRPRDWLMKSGCLVLLRMTAWLARPSAVLAALGLAVAIALHRQQHDDARAAVLREAAAQVSVAEHDRAAARTAIEHARANTRVAEEQAEAAVSRASAARARARAAGAKDRTVAGTPNDTPSTVRLPAPVVERLRLDSSAVVALGTLVRWKDTVIAAQDRRITADSVELVATTRAFDVLRRVREPRCGRKCGIVLGVGGLLAAAVAVEQVRRAFR